MTEKKKGHTTEGARVVAIPKDIISVCRRLPLIKHLFISRMGHFPHAIGHYYSRPAGKYAYAVLLYCYDGGGWIKLGGKEMLLKAGDVFFFPPFSGHSYRASSEKAWSIFWMHISGDNISELMEAAGFKTKVAPVHTQYSKERVQLFYQIFKTLSKGFSVPNLVYANLTLPHYLATFIAQDSFDSLSRAPTTENNYINDAISYMQEHINEQLSVEIIARKVAVSPTVFFRKFKKSTGYSPIAYFNFLKTQKAIQLIHTKKYNISEIGSKIGIDDPYYFSRLFKKQMGVSPRQYMNEFIYQQSEEQKT